MPSFRCKIKKLRFQGILTDKETERILDALDIKDALDKAGDTAEWVGIDDEPHEDWECNRCGFIISGVEEPYRFCPNCGAIMKGVEE